MRATPGACIKSGCLAQHPLCRKVNLPARCEARRPLCHKVDLLSCVASILGDPGAVSQAGLKGATKVFKHGRKSPWVPTLTGPFPNGQAIAGSWLGTKNALYYCAQSANSICWVLFVSLYTTAIDSITACLAHAPKKCTLSGIFQFDITATFQNTGSLYTRA